MTINNKLYVLEGMLFNQSLWGCRNGILWTDCRIVISVFPLGHQIGVNKLINSSNEQAAYLSQAYSTIQVD
jgi:hypothetical protein